MLIGPCESLICLASLLNFPVLGDQHPSEDSQISSELLSLVPIGSFLFKCTSFCQFFLPFVGFFLATPLCRLSYLRFLLPLQPLSPFHFRHLEKSDHKVI